jgi:hypothetical protein
LGKGEREKGKGEREKGKGERGTGNRKRTQQFLLDEKFSN